MNELHTDEERLEYLRRQETINQYLAAITKANLAGSDSHIDKMTGLHNIRGFFYTGAKLLASNLDTKFAVIKLNFYNFKLINEYIGRAAGDKVILFIASELNKICEDELWDIAHFRADDFGLIMPYNDPSEVEAVVDHLNDAINNYPIACKLLADFGIVLVDSHEEHMDALCDCANIAISTIKGTFLDYKAYYDDKLKNKIKHTKNVENRMNDALGLKEFVPYLQPKVDMRSGKIIGAEALVRWITPDRGIVEPKEYISIFENNGFIIQLDEVVWDQVFAAVRRWLDHGFEVLPISVNVSRVHALEDGFASRLIAMSKKYDVDPYYVILELTESAFFEGTADRVLNVMKELKDFGFKFSMDDFGSGYSSLNMLQKIAVDEVKLDRAFLEGMGDPKSDVIITSTIEMVNKLGLDIIAEGIETDAQKKYLIDRGCYNAQGFYFYNPMPIEEFEIRFMDK